MEEVIKIEGGRKLRGSVRISGSKNSTVALIPAAILGSEPVTIYGVPHISDVNSLTQLLRELGVYVESRSDDTLYIDPRNMEIVLWFPTLSPSSVPVTILWAHFWANSGTRRYRCQADAILAQDPLIFT